MQCQCVYVCLGVHILSWLILLFCLFRWLVALRLTCFSLISSTTGCLVWFTPILLTFLPSLQWSHSEHFSSRTFLYFLESNAYSCFPTSLILSFKVCLFPSVWMSFVYLSICTTCPWIILFVFFNSRQNRDTLILLHMVHLPVVYCSTIKLNNTDFR